tara:strand:- start:1089 stop:1787 length:699 start_codon:yes stop_codon:yes gene_type:complete
MLNSTITIKVKQRLNKLDSNDYDNIECWMIVEAFNKAQVEWARRQLHGMNLMKEGDEQSTRRIDDLQALLVTDNLILTDKVDHFSAAVPIDYLQWKRVDAFAKKDCCENRRMVVYLVEEANLNLLLRDKSKQPSFEWSETFATLQGNKLNIFTNQDFEIDKSEFVYYRQPRKIQIKGCSNPYTQVQSTTDVISEFKDDIVELIIDETVSVLAGDIESMSQFSRGTDTAERNN